MNKGMPQHAGFVLDQPDIGRDSGGAVFHERTAKVLPRLCVYLPELNEAGEAPVALLWCVAVGGGVLDDMWGRWDSRQPTETGRRAYQFSVGFSLKPCSK